MYLLTLMTKTSISFRRTFGAFASVTLAAATLAAPLQCQRRDTMALAVAANATSFLVVGDWGQHGDLYQRRVAKQMGATAAAISAAFIISTGDNFYPDGVRSPEDRQFYYTFENVYTDKSLMVDWYPVLGNHDYHGNPQAEVEYSAKSTRWKMPARYYTVKKTITPEVAAEFFFIDTSPIVLDYDGRPDKYPQFRQDTVSQRRWLDSSLKASTAQWKFIVGHHHVYSGGVRPTQQVLEWLLVPMMLQYNVSAYICGHEHQLEHILPQGSGAHYFVSGAGSETRDTKGREGTKFVSSSMGFLAMSLTADSMVVQAVDERGKMLYRTSIKRPNGQ